MVRVLLADDHDLFRAGVRSLLECLPGVRVLGEAGNGREAVRMAAELKPDVVLLDVMMPALNGLDALPRVIAQSPGTRVVMLSMDPSEEFVLQAIRSGAHGYLLKNTSPAELEAAIHAVTRGDTYLSEAVGGPVIEGYLKRVGGPEPRTSLEKLTPRQREVLQLVAEGNATKAIALQLGISIKTVEMHRGDVTRLLDIHDVASLTRFAIRTGLVDPNL